MRTIAECLIALSLAGGLEGAVKLPALISDHMVLASGVPARIWGTADAGETVRVELEGQTAAAVADGSGKWAVWLKPLTAAGPLEMTVSTASAVSNTVVVRDVLVGEVWLGSGQSNMEFPLSRAMRHEEEIAQAGYPTIHLFQVKHAVAEQPADDVTGRWEVSTPESAAHFSAVEYFFGRHLHETLRVPVGLIESDWGGTPAQSWTSREALEADPALRFVLDGWDKILANYPAAKASYDERLAAWNGAAAKAKAEGTAAPARPGAPQGPGHPYTPAGLYNAMIAPLTPYAIRGAIWYQGESNATEEHAYRYRKLFADMIEDWRNRWGEGDFPFLFVQLANFKSNGYWPVLRESQTETLRLAKTGMAVAIDVGESKDIHPTNKQAVGLRLALAALHIAYGKEGEYSGPLYRSATAEDDSLRVWFTHAGGLGARGGGALTGFTVAGSDGNFVPAEARIEGDTVVVSSAQVKTPVAVRYAWEDDPACNLINGAGLPASPFRSDQRHYEQ
ncbi:MAG: sialate O-acetylesterase [Bryobacteraceae bacterium]|jgi:sialate O-acetylesterase